MMKLRNTIINDQRLINAFLNRYLKFDAEVPLLLSQAMRYAVLNPGKRLRPIFALEAFKACGGRYRSWIMPVCCGIELIHTFSLIHDDLPSMDNDDLRRGRPTLHRRFDEGTAILTADALLAFAYELFALSRAPMARKNRVVLLISKAIGPKGMAGGQLQDIGLKVKNRGMESEYLQIVRLKTAELIGASIATGAVLAGAAPALERKLFRLGIDLGVLFQLTDDIIDWNNDRTRKTEVLQPDARNRLQREAQVLAQKTKSGFSALGKEFWFFSEISTYILNRRE